MRFRVAPPVVFLIILSAGVLATYYAIPHVSLTQSANDVDHVSLYQNGIAAISLARPFQSVGGDQVLTVALPTTTIFESLTASGEGIAVKEMRSSLSSDPALHPGDTLLVHMDDGAIHKGSFVSQDGGQFLLATDGGTTLVQTSHVSAVEVSGRRLDPSGPALTTVSILITAAPGRHNVRVSYLATGAGWNPSFILDPTTGDMTFFATLTGMQDWRNVTLDLISGSPNLVYGVNGGSYSLRASAAYDMSADSASGYSPQVGASESVGSLHRYRYNGTVELAKGETVRLPMATGKAEIQRHYYEALAGDSANNDWQALPEKYQLRNTLGEMLPAGPIRVYLGGEWVGSDTLPALGKGEVGNITVAHSNDVKSRVDQVSQTSTDPVFLDPKSNQGSYMQTTVYDLQVRNLADFRIDLRAVLQTFDQSGHQIIATSPPAHLEGYRVWNQNVAAGATAHFSFTIERSQTAYR